MNHNNKVTSVICFGEVLWDIFPQAMKPGGAPLNVAYHLNRLGVNSKIISRVGNDELGMKLLKLIAQWNIPSKMCQIDACHPTGKVVAEMDSDYEIDYEILYPVAWDFIEWDEQFPKVVSKADAIVFGSLIMRSESSCNVLFQLLEHASYRVFDVNLREPFYSEEMVLKVLKNIDLLKLNQHELDVICGWINPNITSEADKIKLIQKDFQIGEILLTRGNQGASYYTLEKKYDSTAYEVVVADTVGSGDAFLAAFLAEKLTKETTIDEQLSLASALGAFVASNDGACPAYSLSDLEQFKEKYVL